MNKETKQDKIIQKNPIHLKPHSEEKKETKQKKLQP